jgi:cytoskeleton protein RodZ
LNSTEPASEPQQGAPSVGAQLQTARAARGWSVQEVASRLRIRPALVEALECGDYAPFTAAAYARGQLRNYARLVGVDEQALLAQFQAPAPGSDGKTLRRAPELHPRRPWLVRLGGLAIVGVLSVLGALWAGAGRSPQTPPASPGPVEIAAPPAPPPSAEPVPASVQPAEPEPVAVPPTDMAPTVGAAEPAPESGSAASPAAVSAPEPLPAATPALAELRLRSRAVSWVEVTDRQGQRLVYELVGPDQERVVSGEPPLRLLLGNAPAITVVFAGRPVDMPPGQHVVRMTLGAAESPASPAPPSDAAAPAAPNP